MSEKEKLWIKSTYRVVGPRVKTQNDVVKPKMWPPNKHRSSKMRFLILRNLKMSKN